jgi:hypothetical protein
VQQLRDFGLEGKGLFGHGSFWTVKTLKNQLVHLLVLEQRIILGQF